MSLAQDAHQTNDNGLRGGDSYAIALFGDMPYNALGRAQYPNLLAGINTSHVAFSVFDGDLKAGGDGPCTDSLYTTAIDNLNTLKQPLVWLPGDNDWTDCWGRYGASTQPFFDPIERLNVERQLFASTDQSLGLGSREDRCDRSEPLPVRASHGACERAVARQHS